MIVPIVNTAIITYPSDYDGWLTIGTIIDYFENDFVKNKHAKVVCAKEHADEEIQRDHFHLYLDSEKQLQITQKYFDIPLPEPCFVFIRPNGTRTYKFFNELASAYGIENIHDPTMPAKIDDYIQKELKEEGIVYEILSVCHPNIQLKKQYGDKYFMLRYVVKQHLVARANFDVDEELAYLQENCEKLCEKANQLIQSEILAEIGVKTVKELIDLLKKYKNKLKNKKKRVSSKYRSASEEDQKNWEWELSSMLRNFILNEPTITKNEVIQKIYENEHYFFIYVTQYINYSRLLNDLFKNRPNCKPRKNYDYIFWVPNKLYEYLMWLDDWIMKWSTGRKEELEHRPKGLILIGGTRTGKTSLISCMGDFSYFKNVWNVDNWEGLPPFTVMDDMDAQDEGKGLSFSWFKPWFGAQDSMTVTDKYRPKTDILNGKPLIWLNNFDIKETFQTESAQNYIKGNMVYVNIGNRTLYEEPKSEMDKFYYKKFDPKQTWYYQNIVLPEQKKKEQVLKEKNKQQQKEPQPQPQPEPELNVIIENCLKCGKLWSDCKCSTKNYYQVLDGLSYNQEIIENNDDLMPLNVRKRKLSIEAEGREQFEKEKGRLINSLELKIHASQEFSYLFKTS